MAIYVRNISKIHEHHIFTNICCCKQVIFIMHMVYNMMAHSQILHAFTLSIHKLKLAHSKYPCTHTFKSFQTFKHILYYLVSCTNCDNSLAYFPLIISETTTLFCISSSELNSSSSAAMICLCC